IATSRRSRHDLGASGGRGCWRFSRSGFAADFDGGVRGGLRCRFDVRGGAGCRFDVGLFSFLIFVGRGFLPRVVRALRLVVFFFVLVVFVGLLDRVRFLVVVFVRLFCGLDVGKLAAVRRCCLHYGVDGLVVVVLIVVSGVARVVRAALAFTSDGA